MIYYYYFPCSKLFTAQKIRNNIVESPFGKTGVRTLQKNDLRFEPIVEIHIGFLLEFDKYSSE